MSHFNNPWQFSFKGVLAIMFTGTFLYFCYRALINKDALALVQTMIPLIGIILGGYFVQEGAAMWLTRSQGQATGYGATYNSTAYTTTTVSDPNGPP